MKFLSNLESKYLLKPKIVYLIMNLHFYGFHQIRSEFAKKKFLVSDQDYGKLTGYTQCLTFFTNILIGNLCDRTRKYTSVLLLLILASTVVLFQMGIDSITKIDKNVFWVLLLLYMIFNNPKPPLTDKIMISYLEKQSSSGAKTYGRQRLWGTFALSISTFIIEWMSKGKDGSLKFSAVIEYNLVTTILAFLTIFFVLKSDSTPQTPNGAGNNVIETTENTENVSEEHNKSSNVLQLLKNFEFMFFIIIIFLNAVTRSALSIYLNIYHNEILNVQPYRLPKNFHGSIKFILGIFNKNPLATITTFGIVFEVIVLFFSETIIKNFGYFWPLIFGQLVSIVRFFAYYILSPSNKHTYGLSCCFELLRGIYFGMIHISSVHIAPRLAPQHLKATSQMIYQGTFSALGSLISGYIFGNMFGSQIKESTIIEREVIYKKIFFINIIISSITILACVVKYGIVDKILFNKQKAEEKLNKYLVPLKTN